MPGRVLHRLLPLVPVIVPPVTKREQRKEAYLYICTSIDIDSRLRIARQRKEEKRCTTFAADHKTTALRRTDTIEILF